MLVQGNDLRVTVDHRVMNSGGGGICCFDAKRARSQGNDTNKRVSGVQGCGV